MPLQLPRIYPITDRRLSGLTHAEQVKALVEGGATFIQLREKELSGRAFFEDAMKAKDIARSAGAKLLINDRVDIAMALGADGVHLGQTDLPPEAARNLLPSEAIVGFSTHNVEQARQALAMPVDYLAIGPIFTTSTKAEHDPVVGLEGIGLVRELIGHLPLVAIGGIREADLYRIRTAGANSAAMVSGIVGERDITRAMRNLLDRS